MNGRVGTVAVGWVLLTFAAPAPACASPSEPPPAFVSQWRTEQDRRPEDLFPVGTDRLALVDESTCGVVVTTSGAFVFPGGFCAVEPVSNAADPLGDVAVGPDGRIFALGGSRLWRFSANGSRLGFGAVGDAILLHAVAVLDDTTLLIARDGGSAANVGFVTSDMNGVSRAAWGNTSFAGSGLVDIAVGPSDNVYVADGSGDRILRFTRSGVLLGAWGSHGAGEGQFDRPSGVAVDAEGNVYVAEFFNNRVQEFGPDGTFKVSWGGGPGAHTGGGSISEPMAIACLPNGLIVVGSLTTDQNGSVISVVKVFQSQRSVSANKTSWGRLKARYR